MSTMAVLVTDPIVSEYLRADRQASGADRFDEVWEGIYVMAPMPNSEHQDLVGRLTTILQDVVGWPGLGRVFPGVNVSDRHEDWQQNYRVPDIAVFLNAGSARDCGTHWCGAPDWVAEIGSENERIHEKLAFYEKLGVRELLIVYRNPWLLELYRCGDQHRRLVGKAVCGDGIVLESSPLSLTFELVGSGSRPQLKVVHTETGRSWLI